MEGVLGAAAVSGRVGQRADGLQQLDDRAGPAVRHDQRQRVLVPRPDVDEVDVHPVDLGRELRQRIQSRLALAPVVVGRPVAGERLDRRQLHALRPIGDELPGGQARRRDPATQVSELLLRNLNPERVDRCCFSRNGHTSLPSVQPQARLRDPAGQRSVDLTSGRSRASVSMHRNHVRRTTPPPRRTSILASQRLPGAAATFDRRTAHGRRCKWFAQALLGAGRGPIELLATVGPRSQRSDASREQPRRRGASTADTSCWSTTSR